MANALYSSYADYILGGAAWTSSVAPMASYALATFGYLRPDWLVQWNVKTVTITATISSKQADIVAVPMSNLSAGTSPTILRVTNNQGLDVTVELPTVPADGLPLTAVYDFRTAPNASTPATVWNFVIANNAVDVILGGALWLGRVHEFTANFRPSPVVSDQRYNGNVPNLYGVVHRMRSRARTRSFEFGVPSRDTQRDALMEWIRAGEGSGLPSIFWPNPAVNDALFGSFDDTYGSVWVVDNFSPMDGLRFTEWSKGTPL